jgi:hypothetical protein
MLIGLPAGEARRAEEAGYQVRILKPGQHDLDAGLFPNQIDLRVHDDRVAQVWEGPRRLDLDALIGLPLSEARWRAEEARYRVRVVTPEGPEITLDLLANRLNLRVEGDRVTQIWLG